MPIVERDARPQPEIDCKEALVQWGISLILLRNEQARDLVVGLRVLARVQKDLKGLCTKLPSLQWEEAELIGSPAIQAFSNLFFVGSSPFMQCFRIGGGAYRKV